MALKTPGAVGLFLLLSSSSICEAQAQAPLLGEDVWVKITLAGVGAFFGFLGSLLLDQLKRKREPRKELSYSMVLSRGVVSIATILRDRIKVLYRGSEVSDLHHITCTIENTGNRAISDEFLRIAFPSEATILDAYFQPEPQPELGVQRVQDSNLPPHEQRYTFGQLPKGSSIAIVFIVSSAANPTPAIHPYNKDGDVELISRQSSRERSQREELSYFLRLAILFVIVPPIFSGVPFFGSIGASLVTILIAGAMWPRIGLAAGMLATALTNWASPSEHDKTTVQIGQAESVSISTRTSIG